VLDVICRIVVHPVEVIAALHERDFFGRPSGQPIAELLDHGVWVLAEVDGVCEPGDTEFEFALCGLDV
jgi:hypothetical protein